MDDEAQSRHVLQGDLRESLVRKEFELHFQTLFDARTRLACGAEALVRWRHPVKGMRSRQPSLSSLRRRSA